jgi:hypothetical protein
MATDFSKKCEVLAELWMNYRDDDNLKDFVDYNDLGLPMAYLANTELVTIGEAGKIYIDETFALLCSVIGVDPEGEYISLNQMFAISGDKSE